MNDSGRAEAANGLSAWIAPKLMLIGNAANVLDNGTAGNDFTEGRSVTGPADETPPLPSS